MMQTVNSPIRRSWRSRVMQNVNILSLIAFAMAALVLLPMLAVVWIALFPSDNMWPHLLATTFPIYLKNTLILMMGVGLCTMLVGTGCAWISVRFSFWGLSWLRWAMLLPLAIPGYLGAYALVDMLEYAGPVQTALRDVMGYQSAQDYWFPEIRSMGAAILILSASLYPYVYLLARASFQNHSAGMEDVARSMGFGMWQRFFKVSLPLARPAIVAGVAVAMMEAVNDFGTVDYFAVQTLTTGIFSTWFERSNAGGAAQLSLTVLILVGSLIFIEKRSRHKQRYFDTTRRAQSQKPLQLRGIAAVVAFGLCFLPFAVGFLLPFGVLAHHAFDKMDVWHDAGLWKALGNTISVAAITALVATFAAILILYAARLSTAGKARVVVPVLGLGYAAPGAVLAVGVLIPFAAFDNWFADLMYETTGFDPGLMITGTQVAIILALTVRFFAVPLGAIDTAMAQMPPNLGAAARSLGKGHRETLRHVYVPLIARAASAALLLVFVDSVKELPATMILRPFNYETLATRTHNFASLEDLSRAAPSAMGIIAVGLVAVLILARSRLSARADRTA